MPQQIFTVTFPLDPTFIKDHPVLQFYSLYGQTFPKTQQEWTTVPFENWYAADCTTILVDNTIIPSGQESWNYFRNLYSRFRKVEREVLSFIVVGDEAKQEWKFHAIFNTRLFVEDGAGERTVVVPQSFMYTVGKADEGKGTGGFQFRELRNYYDLRTLERALV